MDIQKFLDEKKKDKHLETFYNELQGFQNQKNYTVLSPESLELAMILMNGIPELRENKSSYWYHCENLSKKSKRFLRILEITSPYDIWEKYFDLLLFFFGKDKAEAVKAGWNMFPELPYQKDYNRRSFRSTSPILTFLHLVNQLNYIVDLIRYLQYDLTLVEYALYSHQLHLNYSDIHYLWAGAINSGNQEIYTLLLDVVYNRHETAKVSHSIIKAMLLCEKEEAWEAVEKLLLSAQRQEGLRQTILESLDETHLGALKRFIKVILDNKLTRFSSVVRAVDVWAGLGWESERESTVKRFLELAQQFLENPNAIDQAMQSKDNAEVYMALWAKGVYDVQKCTPYIEALLKDTQVEKNALALYFVKQTELYGNSLYGLECINHPSLLIFAQAVDLLNDPAVYETLPKETQNELFDLLTKRLKEVGDKPEVFSGKVFSWLNFEINKEKVFELMINLSDFKDTEALEKLLAYFDKLSVSQRERITREILPEYYAWNYKEHEEKPLLTTHQRDFAFKILKDKADYVRNTAIRALNNAQIEAHEITVFEDMLTRKSADLRKSIIGLMLKQKPEQIKVSTEKLLKAGNLEQRLAGLDMLTQLKVSKAFETDWFENTVKIFAERSKISEQEKIILDNLTAKESATLEYNEANGFGLFDPKNVIPVVTPELPTQGEYIEKTKNNPLAITQTKEQIEKSLENVKELVLAHQNYEYQAENWDNSQYTLLLGNEFRMIKRNIKDLTLEEQFYNYPLGDVWKKWFEDSNLTPCDLMLINMGGKIYDENAEKEEEDEDDLEDKAQSFREQLKTTLKNIQKLTFSLQLPQIGEHYWRNPIPTILDNLTYIFPYQAKADFLEGFCKTIFCKIEPKDLHKLVEEKSRWGDSYFYTWRDLTPIKNIYETYSYLVNDMTDEQFKAFWQLEKWKNYTYPKKQTAQQEDEDDYEERISSLYNYARAYALDLITQDEMYKRVMMPDAIQTLTVKNLREDYYDVRKDFPFLNEMLDICRNRVLEIELKRGDSSTPVTKLAQSLQEIFGMDNFVNTLLGLGKDTLHRGYVYAYGNQELNKKALLSTLLKRCYPKEETQKAFDELIKSYKIVEKRLIEAATYAPQWLPKVSEHLGWKNMTSAVWWLHAHTNAHHSAETETEIGKYSKVDIKDFSDGAVDTDWFQKVYKDLGKDKWKMLYDSAKYISDGNGHKRAMLYADVILGNTKLPEIKKRVSEKRNQDYLRVYGLVPLNKKDPEKDVLERYQYLQKFRKESKQFGSQRQTSEGLAVRIAMDNLSRTAGFSDPLRLTWAMETEEAILIIQKAKELNFDNGVTVQLVVDEQGKSTIECFKNDQKLKKIPDALKKEQAIVELKEFNKTLQDQYKRTRKSLEEAMINGDAFQLKEITTLMKHPVVSPMLGNLVLKSDNQVGFWQEGSLISPQGKTHTIGETLQIAHCTDLYASEQWSDFQRYCFENELVQPFKQIFRELYIPTEDELKEKTISRRYAGHQVQPKKTVALLKTQGWTVDYDEGLQKVFHKEGFIAKMYALADWFSPADVESPTLETIEFIDRKTWKSVPFEEMDKRIFSEVMRDIDLVVSVAHVGDVDPEASQSSIELRSAIIREILRLFKIENVEVKGNHALIQGKKNNYSVHLGSAVTHKVPGVYLSILPVHSQHRGRMFLPFLDEDPKTAEIVSKILLLAKDDEIQDPTILRQL
jgi:hypothetical protein